MVNLRAKPDAQLSCKRRGVHECGKPAFVGFAQRVQRHHGAFPDHDGGAAHPADRLGIDAPEASAISLKAAARPPSEMSWTAFTLP
jgi:hypothetical protein